MQNLHINLTDEMKVLLETVARTQGKTEVEVATEALSAFLGTKAGTADSAEASVRLGEMAEKIKSTGPNDLSTNLNKYLYDD